ENELAEDEEFFALGAVLVSPDHQWLAYSVDTTGAERYALYFKDLKTGRVSDETFEDTSDTVAWAKDSQTLFYATLDKANRPQRVMRHKLGGDPHDDALVYEEPDESYYLSLSTTNSKAYVLIELESNTT